jgi:hypothetical protein
MAEKVRKLKKIEREPGYRYFLDKDGDISRTPIASRGEKTGKAAKKKAGNKSKKPAKK